MTSSNSSPKVNSKDPSSGHDGAFDGLAREEFEFPADELTEDWSFELTWRDRLTALARRTLMRGAWVLLAALLALGSAGLAAATGEAPASGNRLELTYAADKQLSGRLDEGVRSLARMNDDVIYLGKLARDVLANVSQVNEVKLNSDYQDGDATLASIQSAAVALRNQLDCTPPPATRREELLRTYSSPMVDRWVAVCAAIDSVSPLAADWADLVAGSRLAMQVANDISQHDNYGATALQAATAGRYPDALAALAQAEAAITDADTIRATLAKTIDVSTLATWLSRTQDMDAALKLLWQTMIASKGRVNAQVTAALKAVNDAKALLPDNNTVLTVVLYEMSSTLTADGISIETAKGQLANALSDLTGNPSSNG